MVAYALVRAASTLVPALESADQIWPVRQQENPRDQHPGQWTGGTLATPARHANDASTLVDAGTAR